MATELVINHDITLPFFSILTLQLGQRLIALFSRIKVSLATLKRA